jgi:hypothetical protein
MAAGAPVPETFEREHGFTESDWLRTLPGAVRDHTLSLPTPGAATVVLGAGALQLAWTVLPPRQIALLRAPRLAVRYRFDGVDADARAAFMRYFDLFLHRGGG